MDLIDRLKDLRGRLLTQREHIQTEEATKTAFVMPFISALGYDVFNPLEVIPEFTADVGVKKGEKVDYAIVKDGDVIILIECKHHQVQLQEGHASQLYRYFSVTDARFGILTNGIQYQFYSDLDQPNKMDSRPFFRFDLADFEEHQVEELKKFARATFSLDEILATASTLKYTGAVKKVLQEELTNPSEAFVRFFASQIYEGRLTQPVLLQFKEIVRQARSQFINERVNARLTSALTAADATPRAQTGAETETEVEERVGSADGIETSDDERDAFNIIKAIAREVVDVHRVAMRDTKSYCGVLLDNNNRKPICRLRFNYSQKYLGLFNSKEEERVTIEDLNDIFKFADRIKATISEYEGVA